jgi:hypothetical protein
MPPLWLLFISGLEIIDRFQNLRDLCGFTDGPGNLLKAAIGNL